MTDTITLGGHLMFGSAQDDKAPATAGRDGSETATSGVVVVLKHRWPTYLALALVVATFTDGLPALEFLAWLLVVMPVCYLIFGALRGELHGPGVLMLQAAGLLGFGVLALVALAVDHGLGRYVLAAGWLGHAAWDFAHHRTKNVVPRAWAEWCFVVDLLGAAAMIFMS
ncbi:hypothetical protein OG911_43030 [Streptomyces sp. NBC_00208]|uniref:hypothetical protein n=1 Tax=Streptomyces sp. NBC_00208 TaxID=2975681 RepID=UPI002E289EEF|nr:hypothetical protein [Streptomyces sp. NBC_00208]